MRAISYSHNRERSAGFTLVEMLAIAPIIVLVLATFIGLMINMTGDILATSARNKMIYLSNKSMDILADDVHRTVLFPSQSFTPASPQGINLSAVPDANGTTEPYFNGATAFPTKNYFLILRQVATDKSPFDSARKIVRKANAPYACTDTANVEKNSPYLYDVVYFITSKKVPPPSSPDAYYHRWFRRVVFDSASTPCTTPWQKPSCAKGQTASICKAVDEEWATSGYESGTTLPSGTFFFSDIPEPTSVPYGQQWIHPYNDGTTNCNVNYLDDARLALDHPNHATAMACAFNGTDPYSPDGSKNAKAIHFSQYWMTTVAGKTLTYTNVIYLKRGGSL